MKKLYEGISFSSGRKIRLIKTMLTEHDGHNMNLKKQKQKTQIFCTKLRRH